MNYTKIYQSLINWFKSEAQGYEKQKSMTPDQILALWATFNKEPAVKVKPTLKKATTRSKTMPLVKSAKPAAFKKNIATSVKEGKPVKQAIAIAYSEARETKKPSKTTKPKRK